MCGRFALDYNSKYVRDLFAQLDSSEGVKTGEVAPTNTAPVIVEGLKPIAMTWGFPRWDGKGVVFNARQETALEKPMFRKALLNNPCVIPTTGFYEWKGEKGKKQKFLFTDPKNEMVFLAGFYNTFDGEQRFNILTTAANEAMLPYHDRMPVLLCEDEIEHWIRVEKIEEIMERIPYNLNANASY